MALTFLKSLDLFSFLKFPQYGCVKIVAWLSDQDSLPPPLKKYMGDVLLSESHHMI